MDKESILIGAIFRGRWPPRVGALSLSRLCQYLRSGVGVVVLHAAENWHQAIAVIWHDVPDAKEMGASALTLLVSPQANYL
jgi:hypothetical protein